MFCVLAIEHRSNTFRVSGCNESYSIPTKDWPYHFSPIIVSVIAGGHEYDRIVRIILVE